MITNHPLIAYSLSNICAKNYQNRLMCVEVIVCNISVVFLRHSVYYSAPKSQHKSDFLSAINANQLFVVVCIIYIIIKLIMLLLLLFLSLSS